MLKTVAIDPVAYAIFSHRLWAIGEEGRLTLQRVTASPIVAQGGECMQSFYAAEALEIVEHQGDILWRCRECATDLGPADATYKRRALLRIIDLKDFVTLPCPSPEGFNAVFQEYLCPGCTRLLQVDLHSPATDAPALWADAILREIAQ